MCDDDFKFFMSEETCVKLIFNFGEIGTGATKLRKRSISSEGDIISEYTKKVRKALESIDITSDEESGMETESCDGKSYDCRNAKRSCEPRQMTAEEIQVQSLNQEDLQPSTSAIAASNEVKTPSSFSYNSLECSSIEVVGESLLDLTGSDDAGAAMHANENNENTEKVRIIDVQVIKPADEEIKVVEIPVQFAVPVVNDINGNTVQPDVIIVDDPPLEREVPIQRQETALRTRTLSNRISISDSEDENDNTTNDNRQNASGTDHNGNEQPRQFSSAYSFTNLNGDRFESASRTETAGGRRRHFHRTRHTRPNYRRSTEEPSSFQEQMRNFHRANAENFERIQDNIRATGESVQRTFSATAQMFPDLATTFRSHFVRPLFGEGVHQHFFNSGYHH